MSASDFEGIGFALGVVRGARSFRVDALGRLTGVVYKQNVWKPGENEAECLKQDDPFGIIPNWLYTHTVPKRSGFWGGVRDVVELVAEPEPKPEPPPHTLDTCKCGFYGYYDGSDDYHQQGHVSGVVEGYGETVIGTRGFRAMKARIVALHIPEEVAFGLANKVRRNYPNVAILSSFEAMVAAFPPDGGGMEITPETDPDFWSRTI